MTRENRSFGIAFLLFVLMLFKVSAFHVFTHQNEPSDAIENCATCDVALENQHSDITIPVIHVVIPATAFIYKALNGLDFKNNLRSDELSLGQRYCRPPPSLV